MVINGYGISYNSNSYGTSVNKAKTSSAFTSIPDGKPKTESKMSSNANNVYDPFEDMAKTGSVSLPSWIYTKTELTRSEEEIIKDMVELAKRHAAQGTFQKEDDEFQSLVKEWTSPVSPDREEILKRTMKEIYEKKDLIPKKSGGKAEENYDMISTLMQIIKTDKKEANKIGGGGSERTSKGGLGTHYNMGGDNYDARVEDGKLKGAMIRDDSGKTVLIFDNVNNSGQLSLSQSGTEEEGIRRAKLLEVYNETYKNESNSKGFVSGNAFDAVG